MFQAAICEDEKDIAQYIEKTLAQEFNRHRIPIAFDVFDDGNKLYDMVADHYHYDVIFMDIEMPSIDGISICKKIRSINQDALVIFISNKEELVFSTFEVQPFRFIRKSHYDSLIESLVEALCDELSKRQSSLIQIEEPGSKDIFSFDVNQIMFIEAQGKNCNICTKTETSCIKIKLMELERLLENYDFLKPHRSYLVNCKYISIIKKSEIELTDHTMIPISRGNVDFIKKEFIQYTSRSI